MVKEFLSFYSVHTKKNETVLSILIASLKEREANLFHLYNELKNQIKECNALNIEIKCFIDNRELTTGAKRNELIELANGEYICFFDDDDMPSINYIEKILEALTTKPDVVSINGVLKRPNGQEEYWDTSIFNDHKNFNIPSPFKYTRFPNHLCVLKKELIKDFKFEDITLGEDLEWAERIHKAKVLKKEVKIQEPIYQYLYSKN
jgi:glycosyltransferase involved in cell wall biosynthesis